MGRRSRRTHAAVFKAQVGLAGLREDRAMAELCEKFALHPNQTTEWKRQLLERAAEVFDPGARSAPVNLAPPPGASKAAPGHKVLLRKLAITRANQV